MKPISKHYAALQKMKGTDFVFNPRRKKMNKLIFIENSDFRYQTKQEIATKLSVSKANVSKIIIKSRL